MGQKLVNELFKTLADGHLLWNTIIRPEHKRRNQSGSPRPGQKYSDKQTKALEYFACKPKQEKKTKSKGKGKAREQSTIGPSRQAPPKPNLFTSAASSSSAASKSTRRR